MSWRNEFRSSLVAVVSSLIASILVVTDTKLLLTITARSSTFSSIIFSSFISCLVKRSFTSLNRLSILASSLSKRSSTSLNRLSILSDKLPIATAKSSIVVSFFGFLFPIIFAINNNYTLLVFKVKFVRGDLYSLHQNSVGHSAFAEWHAGHNDDFVSFLGQFAFQAMFLRFFDGGGQGVQFFYQNRIAAESQKELAGDFFVRSHGDDALNRLVSGGHPGGATVISQSPYVFSADIMSQIHRLGADGVGNVVLFARCGEIFFNIAHFSFHPLRHFAHHPYRFHRILAQSGFFRKHYGVGAVQNSVGDIGHFGSGGNGRLYH